MPSAWLIKHIIIRSKFAQYLKSLPLIHNSVCDDESAKKTSLISSSSKLTKNTINKSFSCLSLEAINKNILSKNTLNVAVQLKKLLEKDSTNSIIENCYKNIKKLIDI